jgi:P27 family predicted phage terminase small subunit
MRSNLAKTISCTLRNDRLAQPRNAEPLEYLPPPPAGMSSLTLSAWERLGRLAIEAGTLTRFDTELLTLAARTAATCEELENQLKADGVLLHSNGSVKAHPACAALDRSRLLLLRLLDSLGLSPLGREKVHTTKHISASNKFAQFKGS